MTSRSYSGTNATLSYDSLDHFTEWNAGASSKEWYVYDASGNRVLRRSNNGTTTLTVYAFGLEEHTYTNTGQTVSNNKYYYTLDGRLIGGMIGNTTQFFLTDALGSVAATISNTAKSAAVQGNQVYDPYGHQRYKQGSMGTNKGFTGQYNDSLTGLDYYNARYYDQKVGVFLSADVVQGNEQGINPYEYVGGNPETHNDPTGERFISASGQLGPITSTTSPSNFVNPFVNWTAPWTAPPIDPTLFFPSKDTSQNTGGCPYSGGSASDCFAPRVNTVQPTPIRHTVTLSSGLNLGGVLCSAGIGMPCLSLGGNPGGSITVDTTVNALGSDTLCLNLAACIAGSDSGGAKGEGESGQGEACSFTPATVVTTAHGKEAIGSVQKGEKVLAYNPKTHTMEMQPIVHVWIHADDDLVDLTITTQHASSSSKSVHRTSEVVHTNKKHPFLTVERGFLAVGKITVGMHVLRADGTVGTITQWTLVPGKKTMYNLEVAHDHTFTVGDGQWVVHNCGSGPLNSKGEPYPSIYDPRTGNDVPFPEGDLTRIPKADRTTVWNRDTRGAFIKEWINRGFPDYGKAGWKNLDIHHILPQEFGGTNDFENLVPVDRGYHQKVINPWWKAFNP